MDQNDLPPGKKETPTLVLRLKDYGMVPKAIYHCLVAKAMTHWQPVERFDHKSKRKSWFHVFQDRAILKANSEFHWLIMSWQMDSVHFKIIQLSDKMSLTDFGCREILQTIKNDLIHILKLYQFRLDYEIWVICPTHNASNPGYLNFGKSFEKSEALCDFDSSNQLPHTVAREIALTVWYPTSLQVGNDETLDPLDAEPTHLHLGRVARTINMEPLQLAQKLDISQPYVAHGNVKHNYPKDVQRQRLDLLVQWRNETCGTWNKLKSLLNLSADDVRDGMDGKPCPDTVQKKIEEDLKPDTLESRITEKDISIVCQVVGKNYPFLMVELGMNLDEIERVEEDRVAPPLMHLLMIWKQRECQSATIRALLFAVAMVGGDASGIAKRLKGNYNVPVNVK